MKSRLVWLCLLACGCPRQTPPEPESVRPAEPEKQVVASAASAGLTVASASAERGGLGSTAATAATAAASSSPSAVPSGAPAPSASAAAPASSSPAPAPAPIPVPPGHRKVTAKPVREVTPSPDDPIQGKFSLADAIGGLTGKGKLIAEIKTDLGKLECELYDDRAPITVANFIGLARGLRPFKDPEKNWVKKHAYDGTTFHRVIKGFMIQGGDPAGSGAGEPGYVIPDEVWDGAYHHERGLICMANRGPNTNGMQFFIMDGSAPHLDSGYTIFGKCGPEAVIEKIANSEVQGDRAVKPPKIEKVTIRRGTPKK